MRVLVVDDDPSIRSLIGMALTGEGIAVSMAANGQLALEIVESATHIFDVIVLDLSMPIMDGRTFYRRLEESALVSPPVLLLSAYGAASARLELGAASAMDKPFEPDALAQRVLALARRTSERKAANLGR
jgi:DNA-binding response OmpR family regulator